MTPIRTTDTFAAVLKQYRLAAGLTQDELAVGAAISDRTISDLERGLSRYPHPDTVARLAAALRLAPEQAAQLLAAAQRPRAARLQGTSAAPPPMALIGRAGELARLRSLVLRPDVRLVTLLGPAGVGKTRLATELIAEASAAFPDGTAFIVLERITQAALVLSEIAQQLAVREGAHQPILASLGEALGDREALLVLDNFEQVTAAASDIAALLARCPQLTVLVTSRFALGVAGEHQFALAPLAVPAATEDAATTLPQVASVALFCACLGTRSVPYTPTASELVTIGQICRAVDGLPLAIRLAASLVPRAPLAEVYAHLSTAAELPPSRLPDLPDRQGSVMRAIAWSYDLLDAPTQRAFRRLSVCVGGATREATVALIDAPVGSELAMLDALIQQSLLTLTEAAPDPRYLMLATLRAFAQRALAATPEAATVAAAHANHFAEMAVRSGPLMNSPDQSRALAQLSADHDNLRAALTWAAEHDAAGIGLRMISVIWRFWYIQGNLTEGRAWTERILAAAGAEATTMVAGQALYGASILANEQGDFARAAEMAGAALAIFRPLDYVMGIAAVQNLMGSIARYTGDFAHAAQRFAEAQTLYAALENAAGIALTLNNLGTIAVERGAYDEAQRFFERSLAIKRAGMDPRAIALTLNNLGDALQHQSAYEAAADCYHESEAIFEEIADRQGMSMTLMNQGDLARYAHDAATALECYDRARVALAEMGDRQGVAQIDLKRAQALLALRDFPAARTTIWQCLSVYRAEGNATQIARCCDVLALLHGEAGESAACVRLLALAQRLRQEAGTLLVPGEQAVVAHWMARMQLALGDDDYARHWAVGARLAMPDVLAAIERASDISTLSG